MAQQHCCGFSLRFAAKRLHEVATKSVSEPKKTIIQCGGFGDLLNIRLFSMPYELIEFIVNL
ncbi:hypothetical protein TRIUR3_14721 [Triticum urartu]|uniref:Uncharacterized protein n=1 Tax=Triticum urartu TaxID=4572 RepID=M7ZKJ3_TRIUA|nr:hypothetical protein TRIUR3_14721 [Triticum urartu]